MWRGKFSCSAGAIRLSSAKRDDAHQRAGERGRRGSTGWTILSVRPRPGSSAGAEQRALAARARRLNQGRSPNSWPRYSGRSGTERTQRPSAASSRTAVL